MRFQILSDPNQAISPGGHTENGPVSFSGDPDSLGCPTPLALFSGMTMTRLGFFPQSDQVRDATIDEPVLEFSFHLSGRGRASFPTGRGRTGEVDVGPAVSLVSYFPGTACRVRIKGGEAVSALNIYMPPALLEQVVEEEGGRLPEKLKGVMSGRLSHAFHYPGRITPAMEMVIRQIMNCPYQGAPRRLYLESKAMELVAVRLAGFSGSGSGPAPVKLSAGDRDRLRQARTLLLSRMDTPTAIPDLARQVGINTTKLKKGFVQMFGTPVYTLFRQERMSRARTVLEQGQMNITQTAHHFGFSDDR